MHSATSDDRRILPDIFPYRDTGGDCVYSFTIGRGPYANLFDPNCPVYSVPALDDNDVDRGDAVVGEGHHVLDVEGRLTICSVDDDAQKPYRT